MSDKSSSFSALLALGVCIALGLSVSGYFIGNTLYKARSSENTASVKGLAEREVKSDLAIWSLHFSIVSKQVDSAFAEAKSDRGTIVTFLKERGFKESEIKLIPLSSYRNEYRENGVVVDEQYNVSTGVTVETGDVDRVVSAFEDAGELIGRGVILSSSSPSYLYTKLNDIKPEMLGEATRNARLAAEQFAGDAGGSVGGIKYASQGSFSISARNSNDSYGVDESSLYKKVRVVTNITFYVE